MKENSWERQVVNTAKRVVEAWYQSEYELRVIECQQYRCMESLDRFADTRREYLRRKKRLMKEVKGIANGHYPSRKRSSWLAWAWKWAK